jgi:ubiquinone/menaquinone biosynthesis C-methylase UbiE
MDDRLESERSFHNATFSSNLRDDTAKYYAVTRKSRELYIRSVESLGARKRVLEYGCGPGSYAFHLAAHQARVTGIDISDVAIRQAREQAAALQLDGQVTFEVMNAESVSFADNSFDLICGTGILHHLSLQKAFKEIQRTLSPNGHAVFIEPLAHNPLITLYRWATPKLRTEDEHPLTMSDLQTARQYFATIETRFFHLSSLGAVPLRKFPFFNRVVHALDRMDETLFRLSPTMKRFAWRVLLTLSRPFKDSGEWAQAEEGNPPRNAA